MSLWFALAFVKKDNGIADVAWGLGFVLIACFLYSQSDNTSARQILINLMVAAWGLRLAVYIFIRNKAKKGEDFRYKNWRKEWGDNWIWRSFLQVFMLQGGIMLLVSLPIMAVNYDSHSPLHFLDFIAIVLFIIGLYFESVADYQLYQFKKDPANKGKIMTTGLWQYSRHPNYFGEMLLWWGIYLLAISTNYWLIALISPILLTYLLTRVSGVPMLENRYKNDPDYQAYVQRTSAFIPRPPS